ncbi:ImpA family type VI secretion system protein [Pantoea sp. FN0307]|uniref:type VI secretion system protein TssA n=1 Tax=Pantoea sp. FN0307 TaxID=3418560 RepID=UPI003CED8925
MNHIPVLACSDYYQHVMQPVTEDAPCGASLDYDPAFIMLQSQIQPKLGAEYGSFVEAAEPINWTEIEQNCLALLQKSKDIRLLVILMRCRLRKIGLPALAEGTEVLHALLKAWPDDLHPQLLDEGEFAPILRANAFAELEDIHGLLADLRNQSLPRAAGLQISVKEFEKAHQVPREEGALPETAIAALVHEWHLNARDAIRPLTQAHFFLQEIKKELAATLQDEAPELNVLENILAMFSSEFGSTAPAADLPADTLPEIPAQEERPVPVINAAPLSVEAPAVSGERPSAASEVRKGINNRTDALHRLQEVRSWFAMTEPSSPLIPVLRYAEESIGKNFAELLKMYPPEIVAILSQEKE